MEHTAIKIPLNMTHHISKIFSGEYDVDISIENPIILDIGANIGGFARWSRSRFGNSKVICYEPIKSNYNLLLENTADLLNIECNNVAVGKAAGNFEMFYGKNNIGECSLYSGEEQQESVGEVVTVISSADLPFSHILKIDTEGSEVDIISHLVNFPLVFLIEYHSESNRLSIDSLLRENYILFSCNSERMNYGILKYVSKKVLA